MLKRIATYRITTIITCTLSILNALFYFSMRCIWSGIGKTLDNQMIPNLLLIVFVSVALAAWLFAWFRWEKFLMYLMLIITLVLDAGLFFIIKLGASDYLHFIFREFKDALIYSFMIVAIVWMMFYYSTSKLAKMQILKSVLIGVIIIISMGFALGLGINKLDLYPTVYAVEDEYQIVFTTKTDATVWVEVGEEAYYDLYAGSQKSEGKVHKVTLPMEALDAEKAYTLHIQQILMRGPYGGYKGNVKTYDFNFRPVNTSDGLDYYTISDIHGKKDAGIHVGSYLGDKLDMLFILGDTSSYLEKKIDIELTGRVAYGITKGEIPVVYARGNHETKGVLADQLYQYVGSKNEKFYFTFRLGSIWGVVLDGGEDHNDDWWEYYGLARFEDYRTEQTEFLETIIDNKEQEYAATGVKFKIALCHFSIPYVSSSGFLADIKASWTALLNEINVDVHYAGHEHELIPIIPGAFTPNTTLVYNNPLYTTKPSTNEGHFIDAKFPSFIVSKHDDDQEISNPQSQLDHKMTGVASHVDAHFLQLTVTFTNRYQEEMEIVDPFGPTNFGTEITILLQ